MAFLKRQATDFVIVDDQSLGLWYSSVGNWTHFSYQGANNNTLTATQTPGASISFGFTGIQARLYGSPVNFTSVDNQPFFYPAADYKVDGSSAGSPTPRPDTGGVIYFETQEMIIGDHRIDITVTVADANHQFVVDYFLVSPNPHGSSSEVQTSGSTPTSTSTSSSAPSSTSTSSGAPPPTSTSSSLPIVTARATPVGAVVGGVVGGVAGIAVLVFALCYLLKRRSGGGKAYYFERPNPAEVLASEDHVGQSSAITTAPAHSSAGFSGPGPQSAHYDGSSNQSPKPAFRQNTASSIPSQPQYTRSGLSRGGLTYVSSDAGQPRTREAALMAQQYQSMRQPVQHWGQVQ